MYNKAVETNINANKFSKQLKWSIKYKYNLTDIELEACITNHSGNQFVKINEGVLEFLKDNNIKIDNNSIDSINFDTNDTNINTNEVNEATNEIQTEGKIEFTNNNVNDTNVNVNSINNDINRNIDIEKDKAIPSLEEMFLNANDCDLPF
jgi:hypothetical protein